jgi:thermostable 8-oxoguanine DNA glycosylase
MIDPSDITKFDRTDAELEEFYLFCAVVAGKTATTQARLLDNFLNSVFGKTPFDKIRRLIRNDKLMPALRESRLGQYGRLYKLIEKSVELDLRNCNIEDLEKIPGCGPKTARMFLMHSRPKQRLAAIDTHVLKHLASVNVKVPKATPPSGANYRRLEQDFLRLADEANMEVADYDLMVWRSYAEKGVKA